jgi:hypothetical protein
MRKQRAMTAAEAIAGPEARLVHDLPCPTCGCEQWEPFEREGTKYLRCAGEWRGGEPCNRIVLAPVVKDLPGISAPLISNLEGEADLPAPPGRVDGGGVADPAVARQWFMWNAQELARLRGPEGDRAMEQKIMADPGLRALREGRWTGTSQW